MNDARLNNITQFAKNELADQTCHVKISHTRSKIWILIYIHAKEKSFLKHPIAQHFPTGMEMSCRILVKTDHTDT
jgi:hypothetical protein